MRTILLVQEFGANLGHITRLVALGQAFGPHRLIFAVPQIDLATGPIRAAFGSAAELMTGVRFRRPASATGHIGPERTLADVFHALGYADGPALLAAATGWRDLLDQLRPDLIIGDFAPTVRLASWGRIPTIVVTGSFSTPPPAARLPVVLPRGGAVTPESAAREDALLATAQAVRAELGGPPLQFFGDLFQGERVFATTVPTIDPYDALRTLPSVAPFPMPDIVCGPAFDRRTGPHVFCFLWSDHVGVNPVLTALNGIARPSQVQIRGVDPHEVARHCAPQVGVRTASADFAELLPQTRLFIHYGGAGASYAALLAAVPQLTLPAYLEQEITTEGLIGTGGTVGLSLAPDADPLALRGIIEGLLDNRAMQDAAFATAAVHQRTRRPDPRPAIVAAALALMDASGG